MGLQAVAGVWNPVKSQWDDTVVLPEHGDVTPTGSYENCTTITMNPKLKHTLSGATVQYSSTGISAYAN